ncbi:hypothetical protein [Pedobacter lusitanus]|uniref:hypothetical protein n=1 Tax=Pedobacter lusitanus TaxID=1503925 RepID=UPI000A7D2010|nr:hypothetical protein [Pedobacter lusitanus]
MDYIGGEGTSASFDKKIVKKIQEIEDLPENDRTHLLVIIDAFLRDANARKAYGQ